MGNYQAKVETALGLKIRYREAIGGVTDRSKEQFSIMRDEIGPASAVYLVYDPGDEEPHTHHWGFFLYVIGQTGDAFCFDGFTWGYGGEGSHGTRWLLESLGFIIPPKAPPAHRRGCWRVDPNGIMTKLPDEEEADENP
jgi:hypothetical protein